MGCAFSEDQPLYVDRKEEDKPVSLADLHIVQIRAKSNGAYFVIQEPQIVGEFDLASQKDQMAYYEGQAIMFQDADHLDDKNRFLSYWQVSGTGVIKSYFTGLTLASRTNQIENGEFLGMKKPTADDKKFEWRLTDEKYFLHQSTGLYLQSESNSLHNGTRLVPYPRRDGDTDQFKFDIRPVDLNELQREIDRSSERKKEIKFASSTDGRAVAASNVNLGMGNEERVSVVSIMESGFAKIQLGINAKILATFTDPVQNLCCDAQGVFTLQESALDPAVWSIEMCNPTAKDLVDYRREIVGKQIRFRNHNNYYLACNAEGKLEAHIPAPPDANGMQQITYGSVWNIRYPDKHCYFISNENFPFSLARNHNAVSTMSSLSNPEPRQYWNIYNV